MIEWHSTPYLIGPVSSHGFFMALGILIAILLGRRSVKKMQLDVDVLDNLALWAVFGGMIGARLVYIFLHLADYSSVFDMLKVWEGGLSSFGGFAGGAFTAIFYLKKRKLEWLKYADALGPHMLLGMGIGRIGDLILWSEFGTPTNLPWGFAVDGDIARHPTQIYTLIIMTVLWLLLLKYKTIFLNKGVGKLFLASMFLYFLQRFLIEFIRDYPGETSVIDYRLFAQIVSLGFIVIIVFKWKSLKTNNQHE